MDSCWFGEGLFSVHFLTERLPKTELYAAKLFPDFLLYTSKEEADTAFHAGQYYSGCIGILEAKRWGVGLQQAATKKERSPHLQPLADFIKPRVLELCYTAHDMTPFARALGYDGKPFAWDEEKRLHLKCQLDALYFLLYGLTREEAAEVLETFPIVKKHEEAKYNGRYRTRELIDSYLKAYAAGNVEAKVRG